MSPQRPKFSVVVPMFNTARFVIDLLHCFDAQRPSDYDLEFVFVDDGSDDDSGDVARAWLQRTGHAGQVIRQDNGGVSRARNTGLAAATGDWVTFPDSDDLLGDHYFAHAADALRGEASRVALLSANVWRYDEATGARQDAHPLRFKFRGNQPVVDLAQAPTFIQTQAASAFFRVDVLREHGITFVDGLRVAEDAVFAATYLLHAPSTLVAPLAESIYYYRRRGDASSAADTFANNPDFYVGRFTRGYLPLLDLARSRGPIPRWLQNLIIYDLGWLFPREMTRDRKATQLSNAEKARLLELLQAILSQLDAAAIITYPITRVSPEVRALMLTLAGLPLPPVGVARISKHLPGAFEITYLHQGPRPAERVTSAGAPVEPVAAKTRRLDYFGQQLLHERILRLPDVAEVELTLDGQRQLLDDGSYRLGPPGPIVTGLQSGTTATGAPVWRRAVTRAAAEVVCFTKAPITIPAAVSEGVAMRRRRYRVFIRRLASLPPARARFEGAWLVMDRVGSARDNGEFLYEYLRAERPDLNAWFVIKKGTPEWDRLAARGFRLIGYRTLEHQVALQNATVVASSQLDVEAIQPVPTDFYPDNRRPWRFVYLQHGVLQHDLAHWFNGKDIDLLTTAGPDETASITADGTGYKLTSDSVALTGFPRHDDITATATHHPYDRRNVVLIAPTWRNNLFLPKPGFAARRKLRDPFLDTDYGRNWMGLLAHPALKRLAEHGARIVYLPHPNFRHNTPGVTYPDHVTVIETTPDLHQLMASARVTVTDYSSIFFDAALAGSRIAYFQFDQEEFLSGSHTYLPGYWDYHQHGFGPVTTTIDDATGVITDAYTDTAWPDTYQDRITRTLPMADGESAHRITQLIQTKFGV